MTKAEAEEIKTEVVGARDALSAGAYNPAKLSEALGILERLKTKLEGIAAQAPR